MTTASQGASAGVAQGLVVVGVDGSEETLGALRYAAVEAGAAGVGLKLVHVVPDHLPISPMVPLTPGELTETGTEILRAAEAFVHEVAPGLAVESWLHHGTRSGQLVEGSTGARVLVVGRDTHPLAERLLRGDAATGVAARSLVPVVQVPADWLPPAPDREPTVVAGVKEPAHSAALLGDAFAVAHQLGATLVVLHSWTMPSGYDDIIESRVASQDWSRKSVLAIEDVLREWRAAFPDVKVEVRVVHDHAAHALVEAAKDADLVVLLRRAHGVPAATHLGGTARAVLRSATIPVRVVAPTGKK